MFRYLKIQFEKLHVILACNEEDKNLFLEVPIIGFKNNQNLKSHIVRAAFPDINDVSPCEPCGVKRSPCQLCSNMKSTSTFKVNIQTKFYRRKKKFNCDSKMVVYLIECRVYGKQYNSSKWHNFVLELITIKHVS